MKKRLLFTTVSAMVLSLNQNALALSIDDFPQNDTNTDSITWKEGQWEESDGGFYHGTIEVTNDSGETQYFTYIYTKPKGYGETNVRIDNTLTTDNPQNVVFKDISGNFLGGAIFNDHTTSSDMIADFIGNKAYSNDGGWDAQGGAIYNSGTVQNISGDFINNHADNEANSKWAYGGAIYNNWSGSIRSFSSNFVANYVYSKFGSALGGAIYNGSDRSSGSNPFASIGNIIGDFIGNYANAKNDAKGGAIFNATTMGNVKGDFTNNIAQGTNAYGGAIYNTGTIGNDTMGIKGNFTGNKAISSSSIATGGAISNGGANAKIGAINGDFTNNSATSESSSAYGGAIYNSGSNAKIGAINGDFTNNIVQGTNAFGGAIYNVLGAIGSDTMGIKGNFTGNKAIASSSYAKGGAIYNYDPIASIISKIGAIEGNFINNTVTSESSHAQGGAIYNQSSSAKIDTIKGNFINNIAQGTNAEGGAIYNTGTIGNDTMGIKGNFANNKVIATSYLAYGGAIYNYGTNAKIGTIEGDFTDNSARGSSYAYGGAIYNCSTIGKILNSSFKNNYVSGNAESKGGAIYNSGTIGNETMGVKGNFTNNKAISTSSSAQGGAIYNAKTMGNVKGDFTNNSVQGSSDAYGGAISNYGTNAEIGTINGDFNNNSVTSKSSNVYGGAIYNYEGTIGDITGDFIGNFVNLNTETYSDIYVDGGALYNLSGTIGDITGDFIGNYAETTKVSAFGGAISNHNDNEKEASIGDIKGSFIKNHLKSSNFVWGGAIHNFNSPIGKIDGNFIANFAESTGDHSRGGAIHNQGTINGLEGDFKGNYAKAQTDALGGAVYNGENGKITSIKGDFEGNYAKAQTDAQGGAIYNSGTIGKILNSSFKNNFVSGKEESLGGAIYSSNDMTIVADNDISEFSGNYVHINPVEATEDAPAVEEQTIPNAIYMDSDSSTLTLNAITDGRILFNDEIDGVEGYTIALTGDDSGTIDFNNHIRNADITLEKTNVNLSDAVYLGNNNGLTINSGVMNIADLGASAVELRSFNLNGGVINIDSVTGDLEAQTMGRFTIAKNETVPYAEGEEDQTATGVMNVKNILLTTDGAEGDTVVEFADDSFKAQVETTVTETVAPIYKYAVEYNPESGEFIFTRGDKIIPDEPINPVPDWFNPGVFESDVFAMSSLNMQNAVVKEVLNQAPQVFDYSKARVWATPYYSDDTLSYSGFYDVDSRNYGLIAGVDSKAYALGKNWTSVYTLFGAYNDGEDKYQGVKVDSKSWLVGLKASVYNGGFYGDAIIDYASHDMRSWTAFGKDRNDTYGYGAALKAGYKHGFDKVELDTSAMLSWQTIEGDDFTSKSGARISTDDYSRLTLTPQVKLGYSFEKVRPYALVRYNFVLDEDGSSTVNNIALPTIESKDYVEYGLGLETTDAFPHSGYAHVLRHDDGREGWSVTAGYRYNF